MFHCVKPLEKEETSYCSLDLKVFPVAYLRQNFSSSSVQGLLSREDFYKKLQIFKRHTTGEFFGGTLAQEKEGKLCK